MDLEQIIKQFQTEKERLDEVISFFEFRLGERGSRNQDGSDSAAAAKKKTGGKKRRKMSPAERKAVSERMRLYWDNRKKQGKSAE